jgi:hypothetical protein
MIYFSNCTTLNEVKTVYKLLAKQYHPDLSGYDTTAIMQQINKEYTFAIAKVAKGENLSSSEVEAEILNAEQYKNIIEILMNRNDVIIELCGCWLWVTPKDENIFWELWPDMKKARLFFAKLKKKFYFRGIEYATGNKGKSLEMSQIYNKYGRQQINSFTSQKAIA